MYKTHFTWKLILYIPKRSVRENN